MGRKKTGIFLIIILIIISGIFCFTQIRITALTSSFEEVKVDEVKNIINKKGAAIIYYGQDTCSACRIFTPILEEAAKVTKREVLFLDGDNLETKTFSHENGIQGTPTLILIKNGELCRYEGILELNETIQLLEDK